MCLHAENGDTAELSFLIPCLAEPEHDVGVAALERWCAQRPTASQARRLHSVTLQKTAAWTERARHCTPVMALMCGEFGCKMCARPEI